MKISSASKKVLASALSAAMVVAFAPTVAFGADACTITIDLDGGQNAQTQYNGYEQGQSITLGSPTKNGYALAYWWYDADADGVDDNITSGAGQERFAAGSFTLPSKAAVTLKAVYQIPATGFGAFAAAEKTTEAPYSGCSIAVNTGIANYVNNHTYVLAITAPNGDKVVEQTYTKANDTVKDSAGNTYSNATETLTFAANPSSVAPWEVDAAYLTSGELTATLTDNGAVVSTKKVKLVELTLMNANGTLEKKMIDDANAQGIATFTLANTYVDASGFGYATSVSTAADLTLTKTSATQYAGAATYTEATRLVTVPVAETGTSTAKVIEGDKFTVTVADPTGAQIYTGTYTATSTDEAANSGNGAVNQNVAFTFDQTSTAYTRASKTEVAGNYEITVTKTAKATGAVTSSKSKIALTQVVFDAGEGSFKPAYTGEKSFFVDSAADLADTPATTDLKAPEGYQNPVWTVNGKACADLAAIKAELKTGVVNTVVATYTAKHAAVANPVVTASEKTLTDGTKNYLVNAATATAGAEVKYELRAAKVGVGGSATYAAMPVNGLALTTGQALKYLYVKAFSTTQVDASVRGYDSDEVIYELATDAKAAWKNATSGAVRNDTTQGVLESRIGNDSVKWLDAADIKAAIAAGQATADAQTAAVYVIEDELASAQKASWKALYEAVAAEADAQLAKYENGAVVVAGTKAYTMTAAKLAIAQNDVKAAKITAANPTAANYQAGIIAVINAANTALKNQATDTGIAAADITAAQGVTTQLQTAKTAAEAEAALAAFNALTDTQKKLVAATDVAAAQKVVDEAKAQAELVAAQDDAAVSKARNASKTVKLAKGKTKTTKKQSVTLKAITSASGAKVTYKKSSGSSKVSVKSGKAYLAKGVKKGTYKATVKATCGTQTAKITVKFTVKA